MTGLRLVKADGPRSPTSGPVKSMPTTFSVENALVTPLTSMYLHVGLVHLVTNMLYLSVFGSAVERQLGRARFLAFYTVCGVLAAALQTLAWRDSGIPAIGASGAIAGLLGGYLVLRPGATIAAIAPFLFFFPSVDLPAVVTTDLRLNQPRYVKLPEILKAKTKPLAVIPLAELGVEAARQFTVSEFAPPPARAAGVRVKDVAELVAALEARGVLR